MEEDLDSTDDDQQDEDYDEKYVSRKGKQDSGSKRYKSSSKEENYEDDNRAYSSISQHLPALQLPVDSNKSSEEIEFLLRLNAFMAERARSYPKLIWGLKDGKKNRSLFTFKVIYSSSFNHFS